MITLRVEMQGHDTATAAQALSSPRPRPRDIFLHLQRTPKLVAKKKLPILHFHFIR